MTSFSDAPDQVDLAVADGGRVSLEETLLLRAAVGVVLMFPSLVGGVEGEGSSAIVVVVVVVAVVIIVIIEQRSAQKPRSEPHPYPGLSPQ